MDAQGGDAWLRASSVPGQAVCISCGVELASHEKLRWKKKALQNENYILRQRLFEAGQINQTYEAHIRASNVEHDEVIKLRDSVSNYQRSLTRQQEALGSKEKEHTLAVQSLSYEFKCHGETERSLEKERGHVRNIISFLNTLDIPRRPDPDNNSGTGTLWLEREHMKARLEQLDAKTKSLEEELQSVREDIQHKKLLLEDLSQNFKVEPESTPMPPVFESSEEENEIRTIVLPSGLGKQRKWLRN
ncbi:MAG: hypothetical protein Q9187_000990 [Circinaria calcarea]